MEKVKTFLTNVQSIGALRLDDVKSVVNRKAQPMKYCKKLKYKCHNVVCFNAFRKKV